MRKLLLVLSLLVLVCMVHAETPFAICADKTLCVSTHLPDFIGLNLDRFLERPDEVQGGDDIGSEHDGDWDSDSLETMRNPEYYAYIDNAPDQSGGPSYNWYDISDGEEIDFDGADDSAASVPLPGNFEFYNNAKFGSGGAYSRVYVSTNFLIGFESTYYDDGSYDDYANRPLPSEGSPYYPHAFFAPFWDDGVKLENSHCYYKSVGNLFIISWNDWGIRGYEDLVDGTVSLQVVLDMTTYEIRVNYDDTEVPGTAHDNGGSATVGAEDKRGLLGFMYSYMDDVNLSAADEMALAVFVYAQPDNFDFPDPGGSDPDSDGAYEVEQGDPYGPFSWSASSQNNPYGSSQIAYSVELWEDLRDADRLIYPDVVVGWEEFLKLENLTTSTSHTIDTSTLEVVPYERTSAEDSRYTVWCDHYQIAVFATDGWGYTESTNTAAPGGTDHHYWLDVIEPTRLPDANTLETTWGAIKATSF
ncbi:MAG TPA: hypothetical protein VM054_02005 [bacterium]|nr:hypothetical protein [bacterium]